MPDLEVPQTASRNPRRNMIYILSFRSCHYGIWIALRHRNICIHILLSRRITSIWNSVVLARRVPSIKITDLFLPCAFPAARRPSPKSAIQIAKWKSSTTPVYRKECGFISSQHPASPRLFHTINHIPLFASQGWEPNLLRVYGWSFQRLAVANWSGSMHFTVQTWQRCHAQTGCE